MIAMPLAMLRMWQALLFAKIVKALRLIVRPNFAKYLHAKPVIKSMPPARLVSKKTTLAPTTISKLVKQVLRATLNTPKKAPLAISANRRLQKL